MKKIINNRVLSIFVFIASFFAVANGQDNTNIKNKLEEKYGYACYHDFEGGWYTIKTDGKEGACDIQGNEIIPPIYDQVDFQGTGYKVTRNYKVGFLSKKNQLIIPICYDDVCGWQLAEYLCAEVKKMTNGD